MSLSFDDTPDVLTQAELDDIESGGVIPDNEYFATIMTVDAITNENKGTEGVQFTFEIDEGPFKGKKIKDTLWQTAATAWRRRIFECKLGVLVKAADGSYYRNPAMTGWGDVAGQRVKIVTETESYTKKNGTKGQISRVRGNGLKRLDEPAEPVSTKGPPRPTVNGGNGTGFAPVGASSPAKSHAIPDDL